MLSVIYHKFLKKFLQKFVNNFYLYYYCIDNEHLIPKQMKKSTPNSAFSFSKWYCALFNHNYRLTKNVTHYIKEYTCTHCGEQATTNSQGRLEAMTPKLKEINDLLSQVHAKKQARKEQIINLHTAS